MIGGYVVQREIKVVLGDRSYPIYVGSEMGGALGPVCRKHGLPDEMVLITDRTVASHYLRHVENNLRGAGFSLFSIVIPPGEKEKNLKRAYAIFTVMLKHGVGRKTCIVALGGGVVGDLAGFVASTYQRGLPVVQIPTTLLAQVDSSIGGKTAVNHPLGKNMIGSFHQPVFVWTDATFLDTLAAREIVCGLGEIIKYGVILDPELFSFIETRLDDILALNKDAIVHVQATCSSLKADLVSRDEREYGKRIILNFGHTLGHAFEAAGRFRLLKHGEAVLLGMAGESFIAREMGLLSSVDYDRVLALIGRVPLRFKKAALRSPGIITAMGRDKKSVKGKKRFVLPVRIGETTVVDTVTPELIRASLDFVLRGEQASASAQ